MRTSTVNRLRHLLRASALLAPLPLISGWSLGYASALIPTGERSSLLTHIAATESGSLCVQMKG